MIQQPRQAFGRRRHGGRFSAPAAWALALVWAGLLCGPPASADEPRGAGGAPQAVVVLPPRLVSGDPGEELAAAEAVCDRLAERLAADPACRVVDRGQLDRILKERSLAPEVKGPMVAWDVLVRVEVDAARPVPQVRVTVIDLSLGNPVVSAEHPWSRPVPDEVIGEMARGCLGAMRRAEAESRAPLKVRLLEVENTGRSVRMEPLGERLRAGFEAGLARSKGVRLVRHLEAMTAKEEALLLLAGLARLGGGREFAPQADAAVEFRIKELDGLGKTFGETQVEIGWRVRKGSQYTGDWASATAAVKEFDRLIASAWSACARELDGAAPGAAGEFLDEMAVRRKQAQAELDTAKSMPQTTREEQLATLPRLAAAAKLDPSWEEPAYQLVWTMSAAGPRSNRSEADREAHEAVLAESLRYLQRFREPTGHRGEDLQRWRAGRPVPALLPLQVRAR